MLCVLKKISWYLCFQEEYSQQLEEQKRHYVEMLREQCREERNQAQVTVICLSWVVGKGRRWRIWGGGGDEGGGAGEEEEMSIVLLTLKGHCMYRGKFQHICFFSVCVYMCYYNVEV